MDLKFLDLLLNALLFFVWYGLWGESGRAALFNPYVAPLEQASHTVRDAIRPLFARLPAVLPNLAALVFLLLFRAVLFRFLTGKSNVVWDLDFGLLPFIADPDIHGFWSYALFSLISFGGFLFRLWGVSLIYAHSARFSSLARCEEALTLYARPFTAVPPLHRPWMLLLFGIWLAWMLRFASAYVSPVPDPMVATTFKLIISALHAWVGCLDILITVLVGLIIGSWVSMFAGSPPMAAFCREWMDFIMGPLRRYPLRIGMFDLTPIVFFFALGFISQGLHVILDAAYKQIP